MIFLSQKTNRVQRVNLCLLTCVCARVCLCVCVYVCVCVDETKAIRLHNPRSIKTNSITTTASCRPLSLDRAGSVCAHQGASGDTQTHTHTHTHTHTQYLTHNISNVSVSHRQSEQFSPSGETLVSLHQATCDTLCTQTLRIISCCVFGKEQLHSQASTPRI